MMEGKRFFRLVDNLGFIPSEEKREKPSFGAFVLFLISSIGIIVSLYLPWSESFLPLGLALPLYWAPFKVLTGFSTFTSPILFPWGNMTGVFIISGYFAISVLLFIAGLLSLARHPRNLSLGLFSFLILFALLITTFLVTRGLTGIYILEIPTLQEILCMFTFSSILWMGPISMFVWGIPILSSGVLLIKRRF